MLRLLHGRLEQWFLGVILPSRAHLVMPTGVCGSDGKVSVYNVGDLGSIPGKIPWRRKWQPTPVFLPGKSHGQRSLLGYSLWCPKESDTTDPTFIFSKEASREEGCFSIASDQVF